MITGGDGRNWYFDEDVRVLVSPGAALIWTGDTGCKNSALQESMHL